VVKHKGLRGDSLFFDNRHEQLALIAMLACVNLCAAAFAHSTEGCGFSNDAKALLGAPPFSAAGFPYDG